MRSWRDVDGKGAARLRPYLVVAAILASGFAARAEPTFYTARVAPIFDKHCVVCHGTEKKKAGLQLDSFEHAMAGAESGAVIKPGDLRGSELVRRINLPESDDEVMPSDGKPHLAADEIKIIELWIAGGASATKTVTDFPTAPAPKPATIAAPPLAPDWRPRATQIAELAQAAGVKLVPRSQVPTDGLILRTASAPSRCDDAALAKIAPVAAFIVDAELARTKVTDAGMKALAACENLRTIDLTHAAITSAGLEPLLALKKLETVNLTQTEVDEAGVARLKALPALKHLWLFGTKAEPVDAPEKVVAK